MSKLVSIVVPVFNTKSEYLLECLDSIRAQTYQKTEVIIVDDGSSESVAALLDEYVAGMNGWTVLHQQNKGLNMARKAGYDASNGEYVTFIDSDDIVSTKFIEILYNACLTNNTDYAVSEMVEFSDSKSIHVWGNPYENTKSVERNNLELIKDQIIKDGSRFTPHRTYEGLVWGKLYARTLIEKIDWQFSNYKITEDEFFSIQVHVFTSGVSYVYEQLYFYRIVEGDSLGKTVKSNSRNGKSIPYIQIAREVYENFKVLFDKNSIKYDEDDLVLFYAKILIDRTRKLVGSGELDDENKHEYKRQANMFADKLNSNKVISDQWRFVASLIYIDPLLAVRAEDVLIKANLDIKELSEGLLDSKDIVQNEQYGIKGSIKQLGTALIQKVKN